jgi:hypothetical protein
MLIPVGLYVADGDYLFPSAADENKLIPDIWWPSAFGRQELAIYRRELVIPAGLEVIPVDF